MSGVEVDWDDLDAADAALLNYVSEQSVVVSQARRAALAVVDEVHRPLLYAALDAIQERERAMGARRALKAIRHRHVRKSLVEAGQIEQLRAQVERLKAHIEQLQGARRVRAAVASVDDQLSAKRRIADLEHELERLRFPHRFQPELTPPHPDRPRRKRADGVVTDSPLDVQRVARRVEEYVQQCGGRSTKGEVIAAMPSDHSYLPDAFRHLHACRRVRVIGNRLERWPA